MRRPILIAALVASLAGAVLAQIVHAPGAHAGEATDPYAVDQHKADIFDKKMFMRKPADKTYACFLRRYDAEHLAQHPKQKVVAMKMLVAAEIAEGEKRLSYFVNVGVEFRDRAGDFRSLNYCDHAVAENNASEIRFACGVDCEGGGLNVALSKDNKSAIVRLERIALSQKDQKVKPDDVPGETLSAGTDDKIFRLDRVDAQECASLATDDQELAAISQK